tara:strand:+ start:1730 stop:2143 length:414 start_codon:yes stop_codon:yes gene_type:complete
MSLYGRDANGNDAYIRGSGSGSTTDGYVTFHDTFSNDIKFATAAQDAATATSDLVVAVSAKKLRVLSLTVSADAACSVKFETGASAATIAESLYLPVNGTVTQASELGLFETGLGDKLMINKTGSANITVSISYREV